MIRYCHHIGIFTDKPHELVEFYQEKLGFEKGETKKVPQNLVGDIFGISTPCTLTKLKVGQVILEIISPENFALKKRSPDVSGYNHWSLGVQNKKDFCSELIKKGVTVLKFEKDDRFIYFIKDPEGNLIEIYEV